MLSSLTLINF